MKLHKWLQREKLTPDKFGKLIGAKSKSTVRRYLDGSRKPNEKYLRNIKRITGGKVTADSFH